ncbi:V-type proton ATPase subunit S1-like protein [Harpia harpyja]|nr:V-type proton ATPase subunit S1-like protein [Harpia harpyja]
MEWQIPTPIGWICCPSHCQAERGCPAANWTRGADVLGVEGLALFSMERNAALRFLLLFLYVGFAVSAEQMIATVDGSSPAFSDQDSLQKNGRRYDGGVKPKFNVVSYNFSRKGQWERASWRPFTHSHYSPLNVTVNGIPCILFWAKRIMIKFENHTQLDLTEKTFGVHATVDVGDSNCSEDNAMLSLKFGDIGNLKGLVIRFLLTTSYYQLSVQNWFSLHRLQLLYNHSIQATFNATRIYAPASYSYHCEHVSSLQRYDALLIPSSANDLSKLWEVTFIDFQIQGFNIQEGHFAYAKDCASFFSPAILMGLVMSLILLLVLAYALHMLIHLKSLDRHYECKASPAYFAQMKDNDVGEEKEPLRSSGNESYELRNQEFCKIYI